MNVDGAVLGQQSSSNFNPQGLMRNPSSTINALSGQQQDLGKP